MRDYKKYDVWKMGHELTIDIYKLVENYPEKEKYRLIDQMCRASYSIPSNIVEGCGRESDAEFKHYLVISRGSANELGYFLTLSKDLKYIEPTTYESLFDKSEKIVRSINNLIKKL